MQTSAPGRRVIARFEGTVLHAYRELAESGAEAIVSVHLSSELSGTFESAQLAARRAPVPITLVDSRQVGMGTGYAVLAAADAVAAGADAAEAGEVAPTMGVVVGLPAVTVGAGSESAPVDSQEGT